MKEGVHCLKSKGHKKFKIDQVWTRGQGFGDWRC